MSLAENAYKRAEATRDGVVPNLYDTQAEKYLYDKDILRQFCIDKSGMILNKPGKSFTIYKETEFSVSKLTEGVDTQVSSLDIDNITLTVDWYGDAKQMSKETLSEQWDFIIDDLQFGASGALGENRNAEIMSEFLNTTTDAIYPFDSGTMQTSSNVSKTFQKLQIVRAKRKMMESNRELKYVIVSPAQYEALENDSQISDNSQYPENVIKTGLVKVVSGALIIGHNSVQSISENSNTVYQAIALAERATMYAQKLNPVFEFDDEYKRKRAVTFHYYEAFGVKNLNDTAIYVLKSL